MFDKILLLPQVKRSVIIVIGSVLLGFLDMIKFLSFYSIPPNKYAEKNIPLHLP